ncbi:hypothetical protein IQ60_27920 [Streptomyces europaeiscabiei]|nr:hypothetical protein IQ60_27920 [Streptomyces europaeiscabiei]
MVSKPEARPSRSTESWIWIPGRRRLRSGTGALWASMSITMRLAGPQATPTPASGLVVHQLSMFRGSVVPAWKPWHGRPAPGQGHVRGSWCWALQAGQFA